MNEIIKMLLSLSFSGTVLVLVLLLLRPLYKDRVSKSWQYYIWLLVIARLLFPWTLDISPAMDILQKTALESGQTGANTEIINIIDVIEPDNSKEHVETRFMQFIQTLLNAASPVIKNMHIIWLVIALLLFTRKVTAYQSFAKYVYASSVPVNDIDMLEHFGHIIEQNHIRHTVGLYVNNTISSPMLIGFLHPRIVLTTSVLTSETSFHYTVLHELVHYKRMDMLYKWLVQIVICLHWFNPFVYLMSRETSRACELSCDEMVIKKLDAIAKRKYGDTLLDAMRTGGAYKNIPTSVTLNESKELLKGRLEAIMKYKEKSKLTKAFTFVLTILLCIGASAVSMYKTPATVNSSVKNKTSKAVKKKYTVKNYAKYGITKKGGAYYYEGKRIRIFMDLKADNSFVRFNYDKKGTDDLRIKRAKDDSIVKVEYISSKEALSICNDMDIVDTFRTGKKDTKPYVKISRLLKNELPSNVAKAINSCGSKKWYVVSAKKCQYIYYSGLPRDYAFNPELSTDSVKINISDIGASSGNYVLLAVKQNMPLNIYYNNAQISYKKITANTN